MFWEELTTTSKLLSPTYFKIKGNCSMKALKFKCLKYTGENTEVFYTCRHSPIYLVATTTPKTSLNRKLSVHNICTSQCLLKHTSKTYSQMPYYIATCIYISVPTLFKSRIHKEYPISRPGSSRKEEVSSEYSWLLTLLHTSYYRQNCVSQHLQLT